MLGSNILEECAAPHMTDEEKLFSAEIVQQWEEANADNQTRRLESFAATIPVYFHVIQKNETYGVLPNVDRDNMVIALNKGFAGTGFTFVHAATDVTINATYYDCQTTQNLNGNLPIKKAMRKGGSEALNVFVCDTSMQAKSYVVGWANYPPQVWWNLAQDAMFVANPRYSPVFSDPVVSYQTMIHEAGHWLGLLHTFEGGCNVTGAEFYQYTISGDSVADTPSHAGPTQNLAGYSKCWMTTPPLDTCSDSIPGIDVGLDPVKNHMNYISSTCTAKYGEFTPGQVARMVAHWEGFRDSKRDVTCGCQYICTDEVLDRVVSGTSTCRSIIQNYLLTKNEPNACLNAAYYFPAQCGQCNPIESPCNVFISAPVPTKSPVSIAPVSKAPIAPQPTKTPTKKPSVAPIAAPTRSPTSRPTIAPDATTKPSVAPVMSPTKVPTSKPSLAPVPPPSNAPVKPPTKVPTKTPTGAPVKPPTKVPTKKPTVAPVKPPTKLPTKKPTAAPVKPPTKLPTKKPTGAPVKPPTKIPTKKPTAAPVKPPTKLPTRKPTAKPVKPPTRAPAKLPTVAPVKSPIKSPTRKPPTRSPVKPPTNQPARTPVRKPSIAKFESVTTNLPSSAPQSTLPVSVAPNTCAKLVKRQCGCSANVSSCQTLAISTRCNPPSARAYTSRVLTKYKQLCGLS
ncbi:hypothetical protein MPSEU_000551800 [Mayamaea pseudoterrestris]|nr:hypothetical protein MPSEU_000551800 [Mayamaea pseudoterrestris]